MSTTALQPFTAPTRSTIFIASRFEEFAQLRELLCQKISKYPRLRLEPIDLNNASTSHRPPLAECLAAVARSQFMILLVGETYGGLAPGKDKSFTHLEYEAALDESAETRVLVFGIGPSYAHSRIQSSTEPRLADWQKHLEENHTLGYFDGSDPAEHVASRILEHLLVAFYDLHFGQLLDEDVRSDADIDAEQIEENTEVAGLEAFQLRGGRSEDRSRNNQNRPARQAAIEQCEEARTAISLGTYSLAAQHLRRALDSRPLDVEANYWLARLYFASGRKPRYHEAHLLLDRAARVFALREQNYSASHCLQLRAKAALQHGEAELALQLASEACKLAPNFGRARYEYAAILAQCGRATEAFKHLIEAIDKYFPLWAQARRNPAFRALRELVTQDIERQLVRGRRTVEVLHERELEIARISSDPLPKFKDANSMRQPFLLERMSSDSILRQHGLLIRLRQISINTSKHVDQHAPVLRKQISELDFQCQGASEQTASIDRGIKLRSSWRKKLWVACALSIMACIIFGLSIFTPIAVLISMILIIFIALTTSFLLPVLDRRTIGQRRPEVIVQRQKLIEAVGIQRDRIAALQSQLLELEQQMQTASRMFERCYPIWLPSLELEGRSQPFQASALKTGELLRCSVEEAEQRGLTLTAVIEVPNHVVTTSTIRLFKCIVNDGKCVELSETAAYDFVAHRHS